MSDYSFQNGYSLPGVCVFVSSFVIDVHVCIKLEKLEARNKSKKITSRERGRQEEMAIAPTD